ncbi:MAG: hypothetical protein R6U96_01650 [Promethearchaeia archaeon]
MADLYYHCKGIESWGKCRDELQKEIKRNEFVKDAHEKLKEKRFKRRFNR